MKRINILPGQNCAGSQFDCNKYELTNEWENKLGAIAFPSPYFCAIHLKSILDDTPYKKTQHNSVWKKWTSKRLELILRNFVCLRRISIWNLLVDWRSVWQTASVTHIFRKFSKTHFRIRRENQFTLSIVEHANRLGASASRLGRWCLYAHILLNTIVNSRVCVLLAVCKSHRRVRFVGIYA